MNKRVVALNRKDSSRVLQLSNLAGLVLVALLAMYWWHAQGVRQAALTACRSYCKRRQLLLLDDTVSISRLWFKRDASGRWRGWRLFTFEFTSTGSERYHGRLIMLGQRIERIELEPYRIE